MTPLTIEAHDRVLIVAPHPDDESLSSAGLIQHGLQHGAKLRIIFLTRGENNPWPQRIAEHRIFIDQKLRLLWGKRRQSEAITALTCLGLSTEDISFWDYPDQGLHKYLMENPDALSEEILTEINEWQPSILITPSQNDLHPDHNSAGLIIAQTLLKIKGNKPYHLTYLIHNRSNIYLSDTIFSLALNKNEQYKKKRAISYHTSQMILSRNRFMKYAKNTELFFKESNIIPSNYSVNFIDEDSSQIQINIQTWKLKGARISLFSDKYKGIEIRLPFYFKRFFCANNNGLFKNETKIEKNKNGLLITLPSVLAKQTSIWIKFHFFWKFLDTTGWYLLSNERTTRDNKTGICCILPCYNVGKLCGEVIKKVVQHAQEVIVIDDGSTDTTLKIIDDLVKSYPNIHALAHLQNQGKGAALLTAFRYALKNSKCGIFITLDGDAQHRPEDIPKLADKLKETKAAMVIGERDAFMRMPLRSRIGNEIISYILRLVYPSAPKDTQSGFRAHSRELVEKIVQIIEGRRYETEISILLLALNDKAGVKSVPIPTLYIEKNASSHFNPLRDSLRILGALLFWCSLRSIKK